MRQRQHFSYEHVVLSQKIKLFLSTFKVEMCLIPYQHNPAYCHQYHSFQDRRRNPYKDYDFLYQPYHSCLCNKDDCPNYHNVYEYYFHPLIYKTSKCQNYGCEYNLFCVFYHDNEVQMLKKYTFFRFELETFKTELCPHRQLPSNLHQLSSCHRYHNQSDRRRKPHKIKYCHVLCESKEQKDQKDQKEQKVCNNPNCQYAHNKIQQLYHPARYKTKYCQSFIQRRSCQYSEYCSFAHSDQEIKIELLHTLQQDENFWHYKYKTVWCPYTNSHDRGICPYAHNFQDYRRDPRKKYYSPQNCPNWIKGEIKSIEASGCQLRMDCPKSHGWLENKYHPDLKKKEVLKAQIVDLQLQKHDSSNSEKKKPETVVSSVSKDNAFGVGAPFFKRQERPQRSKSQDRYSKSKEKEKEKQKPKSKIELEKVFNFSFFVPDEDNWSAQNDENYFNKNEIQACWTQQSLSGKKSTKINKTLKKSKVEYTKSLKQLLGVDRFLYQKLTQHKISQIKLLGLSSQQLQKFGMSSLQRELVQNAIKEYSKIHKLDKVKYTDSLAKIFRQKKLALTMDKLRNKGVTQSYLQRVNQSTIQDFSFLQEQEKSHLSKILEVYENEQDFKQLNKLIQKQTNEKNPKQRRASGMSYFKH